MFSFLTLLSLNTFAGAVVLVSGREVAWRLVHSIVQTLAKTMDAVLLRQQLQVNQLLNLCTVVNTVLSIRQRCTHAVASRNKLICEYILGCKTLLSSHVYDKYLQ